MATMAAEPFVNHVPTMMGGVGAGGGGRLLRQVLHRTLARRHHDHPGLSHRRDRPRRRRDGHVVHARHPNADVPARSGAHRSRGLVAGGGRDGLRGGLRDTKVAYERIYWDQASLLVQVGLLDETLLPVTGVAQARKVLDKDLPANTLLRRCRLLGSASIATMAAEPLPITCPALHLFAGIKNQGTIQDSSEA